MTVKKFVAFDIETAEPAPDDDGAGMALGVTCIGSVTSDGEVRDWHGGLQNKGSATYTLKMEPGDIARFIEYLCEKRTVGYDIVSWNGLGFDFRVMAAEVAHVLEWHDDVVDLALAHIDPGFQMLCEKGFMIGLDTAAKGMNVGGKLEGMNGLRAIEMWPKGPIEQREVIMYVVQDAQATADTYRAIVEQGVLNWISRSGRRNSWYQRLYCGFDGERMMTVEESLQLPEPDTSWMTNPWPRSRFSGWAER